MARTRSIKPGFFTNDELAEVDPLGRLLFAGLWTLADRDGRLLDRPKKIKAELLPYDTCDADALLAALAAHGFIVRYVVGEQQLIQVANWAKHQQPHINEKPSELPPPPSATVPVPSDSEAITTADESSTRAVPEEHGTSTVLVPEQNGSNQPGTRYPVPGTLPPFNRELEDGAPEVSAADAAPVPLRPVPKPNRQSEIVDAIKAEGIDVAFTAADGKAVKECAAPAADIAAAYCAAARGDWTAGKDDWLRGGLSVKRVIGCLGGYYAWRKQPVRAGPQNGRHAQAFDLKSAAERAAMRDLNIGTDDDLEL